MKFLQKFFRQGFASLALSGLIALMAGCESTPPNDQIFTEVAPGAGANPPAASGTNQMRSVASPDSLEVGDAIYISFSDTPIAIPPSQERVKNDGTITLIHNQVFIAAGKSRGDLEKEIHARYVPAYYKNLTVNVQILDRFYWVEGDVRLPSRQEYRGKTTVLKAIASAQGFTEFARKTKVKLTRGGRTYVINCEEAQTRPELDLQVFPGDKIFVPRRFW